MDFIRLHAGMTDPMTTFFISTLGCKVNQFESEAMEHSLRQSGHIPANPGDTADVCIINTCAVTQKAAMQSRQAIRKAIRFHPSARILVTGCYAQVGPDEIKTIKGIHAVIGKTEKGDLKRFVPEISADNDLALLSRDEDIISFKSAMGMKSVPLGTRSRPFLKIQDGCNAFCTYCIVPHARGPSRSLAPEAVLNQLKEIWNAGYPEVVLTGIHLGGYGADLNPPLDLVELLRRVQTSGWTGRIRLSSIEPREISDALIRLASASNGSRAEICPHFHIPLQSGDDEILKRMGRPYTRTFFKDRVLKIKERIPHASVGVDVLVGFPGETEAAFENTFSLISELPVSYCHIFPFSRRKNTPAFGFKDQVPQPVIKDRCRRLQGLGHSKRRAFYEKAVGEEAEVVVEEKSFREKNLFKGVTSNYIPVLIEGKKDPGCKTVRVRITGISEKGKTVIVTAKTKEEE
ncbi:MAG: tRNA (N(6)-L-threonylcarbamoyladenosine(37)-C(2))-methylthiotransferase MtaB [Thermodesulfobacteriota bacterium]